MSRIERVVCQLLSDHHQLALTKVDFAGLQNGLDAKGLADVGLRDAVDFYESLQYVKVDPDETNVRDLYRRFESLWKEMAS